jgi:predicted transcriptional regulator
MTADELVRALDRLDLKQVAAAIVLGVSDRAIRRYIAGTPIPEPTAKLLRLALARKITVKDIERA